MKQIYGQLAKLLQTRTGRDIIGYIDARQEVGKDKPVIIVPKLPTHLQPKSETESSYAVPTPSRTLLARLKGPLGLASNGVRVSGHRSRRRRMEAAVAVRGAGGRGA